MKAEIIVYKLAEVRFDISLYFSLFSLPPPLFPLLFLGDYDLLVDAMSYCHLDMLWSPKGKVLGQRSIALSNLWKPFSRITHAKYWRIYPPKYL